MSGMIQCTCIYRDEMALYSPLSLLLVLPPSGLISDTAAIEEAVKSIQRNGVGLKGVLKTKLDDVDQHSLNVKLRYNYRVTCT